MILLQHWKTIAVFIIILLMFSDLWARDVLVTECYTVPVKPTPVPTVIISK